MGDGGGGTADEAMAQRILASSPACTNRLCIEFRIQHQKATAARLDLETKANEWRVKYQHLHDRLMSRGLDMASRDGPDEGVTMPNGETMSMERIFELPRLMNVMQTNVENANARCLEVNEKLAVALKDKETAQMLLRGVETNLRNARVEREFIYTDENHQTTVQENSKLVDENERLWRQIRVLEEDNITLKHQEQQGKGLVTTHSAEYLKDGRIPGSCPCGGCKQYESVLQSAEPIKAFQNHMNHTHRVCIWCSMHNNIPPSNIHFIFLQCKKCKKFFSSPKSQHESTCNVVSAVVPKGRRPSNKRGRVLDEEEDGDEVTII